jgi:hypothetical protein
LEIKIPTDIDGFLTQECPTCRLHFKVILVEGSEEPVSFCPYCGFEGHDCWFTQSQLDYITDVAINIELGPEIKKLEQSLKHASNELFTINMQSNVKEVSTPPMEVDSDLEIFRFTCCNETIKAEWHEMLFCVICGKEIDLQMSNLKKVFLSHKGVDKNLVKEYKETLKILGYDPWIDEDSMPAGTLLERGILKGMQDSCGVVFFITPSFKDEGFLESEINFAIKEKRKKSDKFAIVTLQFADKDGNRGTIPPLLESYVYKRPETHLQGLCEIVRALPVRPGEVDWRDDIDGVVQMKKVKSKLTELSNEAKTILLEASEGDGTIMHSRYIGGEKIQANRKSLIPENNQRTIALWVGGIEDLKRRSFIKDISNKNQYFELTREGYEAADEIRAREGALE